MDIEENVYLRAVRLMLKPTLRFCLRHSLRIQQLIEIIKRAALEVASEELERAHQEPSISRLNIMTGIHRAEVARIFKRREPKEKEDHIVYRVMSHWLHDKDYVTSDGKPRVLDVEGAGSTFFEMVRLISTDLNPYTVLFEMERTGLVERTPRGIRLLTPLYTPRDMGEGFKLLSDDTEDLLTAVQENILDAPPVPNLHIKTEYSSVPIEHLEQIRKWLLNEGSAFHGRARAFLSKFDRDINKRLPSGEKNARVAICSFSIVDAPPDDE